MQGNDNGLYQYLNQIQTHLHEFLLDKVPQKLTLGVNLETLAFAPHTQNARINFDYFDIPHEDFDFFIRHGITLFRIGFLWERLQPDLFSDFDAEYFEYLDKAVSYALDKNCQIILNCHNYAKRYVNGRSYMMGDVALPANALNDLWIKIGTYYKNNPNIQFCIMNEPTHRHADIWAGYMQDLVLDLRKNNIKNLLQISGIGFTGAWNWFHTGNSEAFKNFHDPLNHILIEVHQYNDPQKDGDGTSGTLHYPSTAEAIKNLDLFTQWARQYGFKAHLGEMATLNDDDVSLLGYKNALDYMEDNLDVWVSHTPWGGSSKWAKEYPFRIQPIKPSDKLPAYTQSVIDFVHRPLIPDDALIYTNFIQNIHYGSDKISDIYHIRRTSDAIIPYKNGQLKLSSADSLRISDYGLLIEQTSENLLHDYDWIKNTLYQGTKITQSHSAPDHTENAVILYDDTQNTPHYMNIGLHNIPLDDYICSIYVQYIQHHYIQMMVQKQKSPILYNFNNPDRAFGTNKWVRIYNHTATKTDSVTMGIGLSPDRKPELSHIPDSYKGTGKQQVGLFHPQIERGLCVTSPIISKRRDGDDITVSSDILQKLQNDFTIILDIHQIPETNIALPILYINDICVLKRQSNHDISTNLNPNITIKQSLFSVDKARYGQKITFAYKRQTQKAMIQCEGEKPIFFSCPLSVITKISLGHINGYVRRITIYNS